MALVSPKCWLTVLWYCPKCDDTYHAANIAMVETMQAGITVQCDCPGCGDTLQLCLTDQIEYQVNTKSDETRH